MPDTCQLYKTCIMCIHTLHHCWRYSWFQLNKSCCVLQACGFKDGPCCLTASLTGSASATCGNGLVCAASSIGWASKAQYAKLNSGFTAAVRSPAVMGSCTKFTSALCGKAYMPCGKDAGAQQAMQAAIISQSPPRKQCKLLSQLLADSKLH